MRTSRHWSKEGLTETPAIELLTSLWEALS